MTPFWLPPVLSIVLSAVYLFVREGGWISKAVLVLVVLGSFLLQRQGGVPGAAGLALQVGVCIVLLLWLRIRS